MKDSTHKLSDWTNLTLNAKIALLKSLELNGMVGLLKVIHFDASIERISLYDAFNRAMEIINELTE